MQRLDWYSASSIEALMSLIINGKHENEEIQFYNIVHNGDPIRSRYSVIVTYRSTIEGRID